MNIIDFTNKFQKIEVDNDFFYTKDKEGLLYWDIVRYDIFCSIYNEMAGIKIPVPKQNKKTLLYAFCNFLANYLNFEFKIWSKKYIYINFIASKNIDKKGFCLDQVSDDVLEIVNEDSLIIETYFEGNKIKKYPSVFDYGLLLENYKKKILNSFNKKENKEEFFISKILKDNFTTDIDIDLKIKEIKTEYLIAFKYYSRLFKKINPKIIFLVQNGICKGQFAAANCLNIPIVELQHAAIGYVHPAYSYPIEIRNEMVKSLPTFLFVFSNFWAEKIYFPVKKILPIGNDFYAIQKKSVQLKYDLTFIFANLYTNDFIEIIDDLLSKVNSIIEICIKLHPNQIDEKEYISQKYFHFDNIYVITNEISMNDILFVSKSIVAVQSTCVYEALHQKTKVFIFKIKNYQCNQDIFDNPNVYLFDNSEQIIENIDNNFISSEDSIVFNKFQKNNFMSFLNEFA
jgi:hypothetical protein